MLRQLLVVCFVCLMPGGNSLPIVISRYGGRSSSGQTLGPYVIEQRRQAEANNVKLNGYFCSFLAAIIMVLVSLISIACIVGLLKEMYSRIVKYAMFKMRNNLNNRH